MDILQPVSSEVPMMISTVTLARLSATWPGAAGVTVLRLRRRSTESEARQPRQALRPASDSARAAHSERQGGASGLVTGRRPRA